MVFPVVEELISVSGCAPQYASVGCFLRSRPPISAFAPPMNRNVSPSLVLEVNLYSWPETCVARSIPCGVGELKGRASRNHSCSLLPAVSCGRLVCGWAASPYGVSPVVPANAGPSGEDRIDVLSNDDPTAYIPPISPT